MRQALVEFRLYIAELLLSWAFYIAPTNGEGQNLKTSIIKYFQSIADLDKSIRDLTKLKKR